MYSIAWLPILLSYTVAFCYSHCELKCWLYQVVYHNWELGSREGNKPLSQVQWSFNLYIFQFGYYSFHSIFCWPCWPPYVGGMEEVPRLSTSQLPLGFIFNMLLVCGNHVRNNCKIYYVHVYGYGLQCNFPS